MSAVHRDRSDIATRLFGDVGHFYGRALVESRRFAAVIEAGGTFEAGGISERRPNTHFGEIGIVKDNFLWYPWSPRAAGRSEQKLLIGRTVERCNRTKSVGRFGCKQGHGATCP